MPNDEICVDYKIKCTSLETSDYFKFVTTQIHIASLA